MKRRELFWMLIPCLLFAGVALWMRAREARMPADDGIFRLAIEKIEKRPVKAKDVADGYDTQVVVTLHHKGPEPAWWGKQSGTYESSGPAHLYYGDSWRQYRVPVSYRRPSWNSQIKRYEARFLMNLSRLPRDKQSTTLRANIAVENTAVYPHTPLCQPVSLKLVMRGPKQSIKAPLVSQNPFLRIIKTEITKHNATQQKAKGGLDTEVRVYLQNLRPADKGVSEHSVFVVDEKDNDVDTGGGWAYSWGARPSDPLRPMLRFECQLSAIPRSERNVFVKMKYSHADRWPLVIRVPLRLEGKDLKDVVQAKPEVMQPAAD